MVAIPRRVVVVVVPGLGPTNGDRRLSFKFVMLHGSSGFYSHAIHEHFQGSPAFSIYNVRMVFKLSQDKFKYMAIADNKQRDMPSAKDRAKGRKLAYPEAVLLANPKETKLKREVDDKYQYSMEKKDIKVHGWISNDPAAVGFWQITPSNGGDKGTKTLLIVLASVDEVMMGFLGDFKVHSSILPNFVEGFASSR
ncbi:hypothetical protein Q3G72_001427 [Acer saccharum]|nr:hypothetical protein Q3G72_001427 [Acer saccharum]